MSGLANNTAALESILSTVNSLPDAGGSVTLPTLSNEGTAADLLSGKQLINGDGAVVTGTIATKTASNLTASGATVTVPAGYYASQVTKSVSTATQATPSVSVNSSGLITASATQTEGYVSAGTKSGTKQLTTQAAKTITPSTSSQTAVASGVYTTGAITVAAIPSQYEDVTTETSAYTTKLASLSIAVNDLQTFIDDLSSNAGSSEVSVSVTDITPSSNSLSISFSGLSGEPTMFSITPTSQVSVTTTKYIVGVEFDGTTLKSSTSYGASYGSNRTITYSETYVEYRFEDGTLTITSKESNNGGYFCGGVTYELAYITTALTEGSGGGTDTSDATATADQMLKGATAYVKGQKITGTIESQAAQTITPGRSNITIASGKYLSGTQTIEGDSDLIASNIKSGVSIFGVTGTYTGSGSSGITPTGTLNITSNGTYDVTNYASATVSVSSGGSSGGSGLPSTIVAGDVPVLISDKKVATITSTSSTLAESGIFITIPIAGEYRFKFSTARGDDSGTWTTQLYQNGTAVSGATVNWSSYTGTCSADINCSAGDTIEIRGRAGSRSYYNIITTLVACIDWDNGF